MHFEQAKKRGATEGEEDVQDDDDDDEEYEHKSNRKRSRKNVPIRVDPAARIEKLNKRRRLSNNTHDDNLDKTNLKNIKKNTVSAVKALLAATREERTKRGKYVKYAPAIRDEIAEYALEHGVPGACEYYSGKLDQFINGSTVRNFVKAYRNYKPELREEIGKFAYQFGVEQCLKEYENKDLGPGTKLDMKLLKRFQIYFLRKNPHLPMEDEDSMIEIGTKTKVEFNSQLKDDIGRYANRHSNVEAVKHFSAKLRFPMKESTVRKFKKAWMDKNQHHIAPTETTANNHSSNATRPPTCGTDKQSRISDSTGHKFPTVFSTTTTNLSTTNDHTHFESDSSKCNIYSNCAHFSVQPTPNCSPASSAIPTAAICLCNPAAKFRAIIIDN